ncbi:MAG TPA: hypothetical protein VN417_00960 [Candidatus Cryosericum sp.]|nr:hypothetical protein [Candidatus Cryosericum sp.]
MRSEQKSPIKPVFNRSMPKHAASYFSMDSDERFKREHPKAYPLLAFIGGTALLLPMLSFIAITQFIWLAPNSPWLMLGCLGSFVFGIGLFNIVAAWLHQYLGHAVTAVCLSLGALMVAAGCLILYA